MSKTRVLTAVPTGDFWKKRISPLLRLTGRWVMQAGIMPGDRVEVQNPQPGVLVIRRLDEAEAAAEQIGLLTLDNTAIPF